MVMFPFRPSKYEQEQPEVEDAELIIAKNRHGECKVIATTFIGNRTMYTENLNPKPIIEYSKQKIQITKASTRKL